MQTCGKLPWLTSLLVIMAGCSHVTAAQSSAVAAPIGRHEIYTLPLDAGFEPRSATYTPSGRVLVSLTREDARHQQDGQQQREVTLAVMDDDGRNAHTIFSQAVPPRPKDNGIRFMIFPDNKRIFMGDFVLECAPS